MQSTQEIVEIIKNNQEIVDFVEFGNGASDEWITKAELAIGFALPYSYKWWLSNFRGGEIARDEIYSVYEMDFE